MRCLLRHSTAVACRALAGLVVLLAAAPAAAAWGVLLAPADGAILVAGELAPLRWSELPAAVDEFELLLSVDDGRSFPIRLTPQLDPALDRFSWRVPNLPAAAARLRLRVGLEGRELEGPVGARFAIVTTALEPVAGLERRGGEWWLVAGPAVDRTPAAPRPSFAERRSRPSSFAVATLSRHSPVPGPGVVPELVVRSAAVGAGPRTVRGDHRRAPLTPLRP